MGNDRNSQRRSFFTRDVPRLAPPVVFVLAVALAVHAGCRQWTADVARAFQEAFTIEVTTQLGLVDDLERSLIHLKSGNLRVIQPQEVEPVEKEQLSFYLIRKVEPSLNEAAVNLTLEGGLTIRFMRVLVPDGSPIAVATHTKVVDGRIVTKQVVLTHDDGVWEARDVPTEDKRLGTEPEESEASTN